MDETVKDRQAEACLAFAAALADGGVRRVFASPGYRNAHLLWAFSQEPRLCVETVIDERMAAFCALGYARAKGEPTATCSTSGTAAGHYLPAVMEARASGVPLILVTADRPSELQGMGANQTTAQRGLFGPHVVGALELAFAALTDQDAPGIVDMVGQRTRHVVQRSRLGSGPVHINVEVRNRGTIAQPGWRPEPRPLSPPRLEDHGAAALLASFLHEPGSGVIVDGPPFGIPAPKHRERLCALSRALRWPIVADALAPTRGAEEAVSMAPAWLAGGPRPDKVLWFGRAPTARETLRWLRQCDAEILHVHRADTPLDPLGKAQHVFGDAALLDRVVGEAGVAFLRRPGTAEGRRWQRFLEADASWEAPILQRLLDNWSHRNVFLGNSRVVRDVDRFVVPSSRHRFFGNRGLSGIDGNIATAWGIARAGAPVLAILGDVSMAHDLSTLFLAPADVPMAVAVIDNGGGQIFSNLPVADLPDFEARYLTPPRLDMAAIARAAGWAVETGVRGEVSPRTLYWLRVDPARAAVARRDALERHRRSKRRGHA